MDSYENSIEYHRIAYIYTVYGVAITVDTLFRKYTYHIGLELYTEYDNLMPLLDVFLV